MRIAFVLNQYPSLSETFIDRDIQALRRRGFEIEVWALQAGTGARAFSVSTSARLGAKLQPHRSDEHWEKIGRDWAAREKGSLKSIDHIHAGWASFPASIARGAAKVLGVPWSFSGHARDIWVENERLAEKIRSAKFVATCTRSGQSHLQSLAPGAADRVLYAPHGIEPKRFPFNAKSALRKPMRALAVGRLVEKKGFSILLEAMAYETQSSWNLSIIGEGEQRSHLEKKIRRLGLQSRVILRGACDLEGVVAAMKSSDFLIAPSTLSADGDRDGLPNVLLEAAALGLPIVSCRSGAVGDLLDESCAHLCDAGDPLALYETMSEAAAEFADSLQRAQVARARVEERFDVDKNIAVLVTAFDE